MLKLGRRQRAGLFICARTSMPRMQVARLRMGRLTRMSGALLNRARSRLSQIRRDIRGTTRMSPWGRARGATPLADPGYAIGSKR